MLKQKIMWVIWPAFMLAGVLEILVFGLVDPYDLHWLGLSLDLSRLTVYSLGFFAFWIITAASSALTVLLAMPSTEVNE